MTLETTAERLHQLAAGIREDDEAMAIDRLLQRVAVEPEAAALRDVLVLVGARETLLAVEEGDTTLAQGSLRLVPDDESPVSTGDPWPRHGEDGSP